VRCRAAGYVALVDADGLAVDDAHADAVADAVANARAASSCRQHSPRCRKAAIRQRLRYGVDGMLP
jgi:hypothetical protein